MYLTMFHLYLFICIFVAWPILCYIRYLVIRMFVLLLFIIFLSNVQKCSPPSHHTSYKQKYAFSVILWSGKSQCQNGRLSYVFFSDQNNTKIYTIKNPFSTFEK